MKNEPTITITETTKEFVASYMAKIQARTEKRLMAKEYRLKSDDEAEEKKKIRD